MEREGVTAGDKGDVGVLRSLRSAAFTVRVAEVLVLATNPVPARRSVRGSDRVWAGSAGSGRSNNAGIGPRRSQRYAAATGWFQ